MGNTHYKEDNLYASASSVEIDFRAEAIAAFLIEAGSDPEKLLILREGGNRHHIAKDIHAIEYKYSQSDQLEYLEFYTNRSSIYDSLPEAFFHQALNTANGKHREDSIEEVRRHRQEEFFARRYFKAFEVGLDEMLISAQLYEGKLDKKNVTHDLSNIFKEYWHILDLLTLKQIAFFIDLIPVMEHISRSHEMMGDVMSVLLGVSVKIGMGKKIEVKTQNAMQLGSSRLGYNTVLGKTCKDGYRSIHVNVGPATPSQMKSFETGQISKAVLDKLLAWLIPETYPIELRFHVHPEHAKFRLSSPSHKCYLGINTRI